MTNILRICITLSILSTSTAWAQESFVIYTADSSVKITSNISKFDYVDDLLIQGRDFELHWHEEPIPDSTHCESLFELSSTCCVLNLPLLFEVVTLNDSMIAVYGSSPKNAILNRHVIVLNIVTGQVLGWYAYFTSRSSGFFRHILDTPNRTLLIGSRENEMLESEFYTVDRAAMRFTQYGTDQEWLWQMVARLKYPAIVLRSPRVYYGIRF